MVPAGIAIDARFFSRRTRGNARRARGRSGSQSSRSQPRNHAASCGIPGQGFPRYRTDPQKNPPAQACDRPDRHRSRFPAIVARNRPAMTAVATDFVVARLPGNAAASGPEVAGIEQSVRARRVKPCQSPTTCAMGPSIRSQARWLIASPADSIASPHCPSDPEPGARFADGATSISWSECLAAPVGVRPRLRCDRLSGICWPQGESWLRRRIKLRGAVTSSGRFACPRGAREQPFVYWSEGAPSFLLAAIRASGL